MLPLASREEEVSMLPLTPQGRPRSTVMLALKRFFGCVSSGPRASDDQPDPRPEWSAEAVDPTGRLAYDASLLFCRMAMLGIDREQLAASDPLLFRELQARCTLCRDKRRCVRELGGEITQAGWPDYCPNDRRLRVLATPP
jgi:hypothetical protein